MEALITKTVDEIEEQQTQREADEVKSNEFQFGSNILQPEDLIPLY